MGMTKKRIFIVIIFLLSILFVVYKLSILKPKAFIHENEIIRQLKEFEPNIVVQTIEDIIQVDGKHYFVPASAEDGQRLSLYYQWVKGKWRITYIDIGTNEFIYGWQLDSKDPSSIVFVWHFPKETLEKMDVYLIKNRNYFISQGRQLYSPKIQLKETITIDKHYGVQHISETFAKTIHHLYSNELQQTNFNLIIHNESPQFFAKYYYKTNFQSGGNGFSYTTGYGRSQLHIVMSINEADLE